MKYGIKATFFSLGYIHPRFCFIRHLYYTELQFRSMNTKFFNRLFLLDFFNRLFLLDFYWQNKDLETEIIVALYPFER